MRGKITVHLEPGPIDETWRQSMCRWVETHGLDPMDILIGSTIIVNRWTRSVTVECVVRNSEDRMVIDERDPLRVKTRNVVVPWTGIKPPSQLTGDIADQAAVSAS